MARLLLLNGPNLNLLGTREPAIYGTDSLASIESARGRGGARAGARAARAFQSNAEHELIELIHRAKTEGIGFACPQPRGLHPHQCRAARCARCGTALAFIEVHLSNTHAREAFRRHSYFSDIAVGAIGGLGAFGYEAAIRAAALRLARPA